MTPRLFMLWLHRGALAVLVAAGCAMLFAVIAAVILFFASQAHGPAQLLVDIALAKSLAALFAWSGGAFMLALAVWLILTSWLRAFWPEAVE